jgi:hypothetical protein
MLVTTGWVAAVVAATTASWSAVSVVRTAVLPARPPAHTAAEGDGSAAGAADTVSRHAGSTSPGHSAAAASSGHAAPGGRGHGSDDGRGGSDDSSGGSPEVAARPPGAPATGTPTAISGVIRATGVGGSAAIRCVNSTPQVVNATPNVGFTESAGDGGSVRFTAADGRRTDITAVCLSGNTPQAEIRERAANGGGGGDDGGGGSGPGSGGSGSSGGSGGSGSSGSGSNKGSNG